MKNEVIVLHLKWITEEVTEIVHMVTVKDEPPILVWKNNYDELQVTVINMLHTLRLHLPMGEEKRGNLELMVETEDKRYSDTVASAGNVPSSDLMKQCGSYFSVLSTMMEGVKCFIRNLEGEKS